MNHFRVPGKATDLDLVSFGINSFPVSFVGKNISAQIISRRTHSCSDQMRNSEYFISTFIHSTTSLPNSAPSRPALYTNTQSSIFSPLSKCSATCATRTLTGATTARQNPHQNVPPPTWASSIFIPAVVLSVTPCLSARCARCVVARYETCWHAPSAHFHSSRVLWCALFSCASQAAREAKCWVQFSVVQAKRAYIPQF